jgi:hypothetical protein
MAEPKPGCQQRAPRPLRSLVPIVATLAGLAAGGCGGDSPEAAAAESYATPDSIATALGCSGYEHTDKEDQEIGVGDEGQCEWDNENVKLYTFKDQQQMANYEGMARSIGCEVGKAFGLTSFTEVVGSRWIVAPDSKTTSEKVAAKIGGKVRTVECS